MTFDKYKFYGELQTMQHKVTNHLADMAYTKPTFNLPEGFTYTPSNNFGGSIWRCIIGHKDHNRTISIYFDIYGALGAVDKPYYECYAIDGDCKRYYVSEFDDMVIDIVAELTADNTRDCDCCNGTDK